MRNRLCINQQSNDVVADGIPTQMSTEEERIRQVSWRPDLLDSLGMN